MVYYGVNNDLPKTASHEAESTVTERYSLDCHDKCSDPNWRKLKALAQLFALTPTEIAKAAGVSRPAASRLLSERDSYLASGAVFRRLEGGLGRLVENRTRQFFKLEAVPPPQ